LDKNNIRRVGFGKTTIAKALAYSIEDLFVELCKLNPNSIKELPSV